MGFNSGFKGSLKLSSWLLEAPVSFGVGLPYIHQKKRRHFPLTKHNEAEG